MVPPRMPGRRSERHATLKELRRAKLHTVCEEARCPNINACFGAHTATFLIQGDVCTRHCRFCGVRKAERPKPLDPDEPQRIAQAVSDLGLRHAVITSVTRDDLPDGGASAFAATVRAIRAGCPGVTVEVLVPDFQGSTAALELVLREAPEVLNHNLETVPRLYPEVRPEAVFERSLALLAHAHLGERLVKTGLMVGLGEREDEVLEVLSAIPRPAVVTIGQYLRPTRHSLPVQREVGLEEFQRYTALGQRLGLRVAAGPLVRSSFHAAEIYQEFSSMDAVHGAR